ncbi:MAG: PDZ domain-containing protein [Planctomycetota bacterium]
MRSLLVLLLALWGASLALAQTDVPPTARALGERIVRAFDESNYDEAERLLRQQLQLIPRDFVPHYNLACALAMRDQTDAALDSLQRAVELGFSDSVQLRLDPNLASVRDHARFERILEQWHAIVAAQADARERVLRGTYGDTYAYARDESLRLLKASSLDPRATAEAHAEIERVTRWALRNVFADLADDRDQYQPGHDAWVSVILPTPKDFLGWTITTYGPAARGNYFTIGGAYSHDHKQLVAQDIGATLRHEFFHVLHHRSTTRLNQQHPVWIQEGLACLVEDMDPTGPQGSGARPRPVASWRTNIAKRLERSTSLMRIEDFAAIPRDRFNRRRPMARYAQARAFFMYLHDLGKLAEFYSTYTATHAEDPSGLAAIRALFPDQSLRQINTDYRKWIRNLAWAPEELKPGDASLGLEIETGSGDGPRIVEFPRGDARKAGLRKGDVITAINRRPTRDQAELVRVLAAFEPGDTVTLTLRRRSEYLDAPLTLKPFEPRVLP